MLTNDKTPPTSAADRAALYRERRSEGIFVARVEVDREDVNSLIEYGLLDRDNSADRREVGEAIELLLLALFEGAVGIDAGWLEENGTREESASA